MGDAYLLQLCREYLDVCDAMKSGGHDTDAMLVLSAQRTWTHNELIRLTGHERPFDMKQFARDTLADRAALFVAPPTEG